MPPQLSHCQLKPTPDKKDNELNKEGKGGGKIQMTSADTTCRVDGQCHNGEIPASRVRQWRPYSHSNATGDLYANMLPCHN